MIVHDLGSDIAAPQLAGEQSMATELSRLLTHHYPGWPWAVNVCATRGIVTIQNWSLSESNGWRLKYNALSSPQAIRDAAVRCGGEILERHNQSRSRAPEVEHRLALGKRAAFA